MTPTLMVVAVSPTSLPGAVPAGEADGEAAADDGAAADDEVAAAGELLLPLPEELHPAASRTAASSAVTSPARWVRLRTFRPAPPRPGPSLLGLTPVPSTTSLPVRFDPATPVRSHPTRTIYRAVGIKQRRTAPPDERRDSCDAAACR